MARSDASNAFGAMASNMSNAVDGVGKLVEAIISERANFAVKHAESHFRKVLSLPAMADLPGGETECDASKPSSFRKPPAMVAISGE